MKKLTYLLILFLLFFAGKVDGQCVTVGSDQTICQGGVTETLGGSLAGGDATTAVWADEGNGTFSNPNDLNSTWKPAPGYTGTETLTLTATDGSTCTGQFASVKITVNPTVAASVSIGVSGNNICSGTSVTFTPTPVGGGNSPAYQWYKNSSPVSTGSTYTYDPLNGDQVYVVMTSNATCVTGSPATSNTVTMLVTSTVTASVSIGVSGNNICSGTSVTFTPTPVGGGSSPAYQWFKNSSPVSTGSTYTYVPLNGDQVYVVMTSNATCVTGSPATSNTITMLVTSAVTASVSIGVSGNNICSGTSVTFTPTPVGGGSSPAYQWYKNSSPVSTGSTYTYDPLNGDQVYVVMTSNATCATGSPATSNTVTMSVTSAVTASVSIGVSGNNICSGTSVTFTPTPVGGGSSPAYQWFKNSSPVSTGSTYTYVPLNGDQVYVVMTSNATCVTGSPATSNTVTMLVTSTVTASVSIGVSDNNICSGTSVTFTPTPVGGGSSPAYQWFKNSSPVSTGPTYTYVPLNGDQVYVAMTSNATCVTGSPATSNTITMLVTSTVTASVSIGASANPVCSGIPVTFTANPSGGGTTPTYQWYKNTVAVSTGPTYTYVPANGDAIYAVMTSNASCATGNPATSNTITMVVNPLLPASVVIVANPSGSVCSGSLVTFTATPINGGTPSYQWKVNGSNVGINNSAYTSTTLSNNDVVSVVMTSSLPCTSGSPATSNPITVVVNPALPASVVIAASPSGAVCTGTSVTFTATPTNGGTPVYQWKVNGSNFGTNSPTFTSATLSNNDVVTVVMTSSATCVTGSPATSNPITMTVNPLPIPTLTSSDADHIICQGTSVTFTAGGGTTYSFRVGGVVVQTGSLSTYTTTSLNNAQTVDVIVSNAGGCSATSAGIQFFVNQPPFIGMYTPTTCSTNLATYSFSVQVSSGTVTVTPSGTVTNAGNIWTISAVPAGVSVLVKVVDSGGCENPLPVSAPDCTCPVVLAPVSGGNKSYCAGGIIPAINATVLTGETVDWYNVSSGGTPVGSGLSYTPSGPGTYYALARNTTTNCVSSTRTAVTVTMNPLPIATLASSDVDNIFCSGTSVTFTAGGGNNYNFRVGGVSVQNGASTTYITTSLTNGQVVDVIVTNSNGCSATSAGITNTVIPLVIPALTSSDADNSFCAGTSVTFTAGGGTNYNFRVNGVSVQNGALATYTTNSLTNGQVVDVIVSNASGCTATSAGITNSVYAVPTPNAGTGGNNCGLTFHLNGSLNVGTGTWSKVSGPGNATFSPDANTANAIVTVTAYGTYIFKWTVANGTCSASANVTVVFIQQLAANAGSGGNSCNKEFLLNALVPAIGTGTWTKTSGPGNAVFTPDNHQANAKVTVDQFGSYNFAWTVINSTCTSSDIINVVFHDLPAISAGRDTTICKGSGIQLQAIGTGTVSWTPVSLVNNPNIINPVATPDTTTTFTVNLTDQFGCKNSDSIIIEVRDKITANAGPDQELGNVFTTTMDARLVHSYEHGAWSVISGTGDFSDSTYAQTSVNRLSLGTNKFLWTVTNGYCPLSRDTALVTVNDFVIPTLITPNMDGRNDYFVLRGLATLGKTELIIFDRRGVQVYRNRNYDNSWNGVDYNKKPLPDDTYFYVIKTANGKSISGYVVIRH